MDTSGIIMVAKTSFAQANLSAQMQSGEVDKRYLALVFGAFENPIGTINLPIGRPFLDEVSRAVMQDGQESITHYSVIRTFSNNTFSLLSIKLETGRTHQIRVHMSHIGHPIVGDYLYGGDFPTLMYRQALHAEYISFNHPTGKNRIELKAPLPGDIKTAIEKLSK